MLRSQSQSKLMFAALNSAKVRKKTGIKKAVASDFIQATPKSAFSELKEKISKPKKY